MHLYFCNYALLLLFQSDIPVFTTPEPRCNDFDVRLANMSFFVQDGNGVAAGNVETCLNGSYFSICDTDWDDVDAQLICNALGYIEPYFRKFMMLGHLTTLIWLIFIIVCYSSSLPQVVLLCLGLLLPPNLILRMSCVHAMLQVPPTVVLSPLPPHPGVFWAPVLLECSVFKVCSALCSCIFRLKCMLQ